MAGLIGIFGGSFDPPHLGHLILADEGRIELGLDRVLWVVTADPPHKPQRPLSGIQDRIEMVQRAINDHPTFEISLLEAQRPGPHFAVETVRLLREQTQDKLVYLMGEDSLRDLPSWRDPGALVDLCTNIGVMRRSGVEPNWDELDDQVPALRDKVKLFSAPRIDISSSMIRERIVQGRPYRYFLIPSVSQYIQSTRLYLG